MKITKNTPAAFSTSQRMPAKNMERPFWPEDSMPNKTIMDNVNQMVSIRRCSIMYR